MAKQLKTSSRFVGGISDFDREGAPDSHAFSRAVDFRNNPTNLTLLPVAIKESGSVVTDLPKWGELYLTDLTSYIYGNTGNLYSRTLAGSYSFLRQIGTSHGNGLVYSQEDDFLWYANDKGIGRYGPLASTTPTFVDDFFGSQGGVPLNTNSLTLVAASSQYADRADTASLSITSDLSISAQINPTTLPAVGASQVLASKWNINGNLRSYMLDITGVSGYFGDGSSGAYTVSTNTTDAPTDSACTGTVGTQTLTATNASFAAGQVIFIHQSQGTGAGAYQRNTVSSYTAGTITLGTALNATYTTGAQVLVMNQYTNVTINSGITLTVKPWNGTTGGILSFIANGTITITGSINANGGNSANAGGSSSSAGGIGGGFRGGQAIYGGAHISYQGEGTVGVGTQSTSSNGNGGGGANGGGGTAGAYGAGGGNSTTGISGGPPPSGATSGIGGSTAGTTDLTTLTFGGGGGGGQTNNTTGSERSGGGSGGGIILLIGATITMVGSGLITANGGHAASSSWPGGEGAAGSILLKAQNTTLGTNQITAVDGNGGGAAGGNGRVHLDYYASYSGTSNPALDVTQDNTLVTNTSYQLRLSLSSTGTNSETLAMVFVPILSVWQQVGVFWVASTSTATFYLNTVSLGTRVGTFTAIADTTARFSVGCSFDSGGSATNFYNGQIDEVQVYNSTQTQTQFLAASTSQVSTTSAGLQGYYKFNGDYTDSTANANNLTSHGTPVFTTNVPFPSPTTRLDIDQNATTAGNTYTPPTAISEAAADRLTFTPAKDPQKSMAVLVATVGTGAWTITIHDSVNTTIATSTIVNTSMSTGYVEFTFASLWRPLTGFTNTYHAHITSTVADGAVTTTTASALETVSYRTYYQFLMTDTAWHPMARFLQFWVVGNGKWVGKYEATLYEPNKIPLGAGWRARCFGYWGEYIAIGAMRDSTNIYDTDRGRVYFWDGAAPTYNYSIEVPEGGVNALLGNGSTLYIWAGYQNQLLEYHSNAVQSSSDKVKFLPKMETTTYSETYPQGVTMWHSLLRWGASGNSNSTTLPRGVYAYGKSSVRYDDALSCDYIPSTGNSGSTVSIGLLMVVNRRLLIGWQDGTGFGIDYIDPTTTTFGAGTIEFLIDDQEQIWKTKDALNLKVVFAPLNSGDSVSLKYKINDAANWSTSTTTTTIGDTSLVLPVPTGREQEFQYACDISTTATTTPTIKGLGFELDDLREEQGIGTINE
jgi:hypothetical protein